MEKLAQNAERPSHRGRLKKRREGGQHPQGLFCYGDDNEES